MSKDEGGRASAISLGLAGGIEYGLQWIVPIILVRFLDESVYGQYRLLWLMTATAVAVAPAFMPQSLFYFLSRSEQGEKFVVVGNVLVYLMLAGGFAALLTSGLNPWLQESARDIFVETHGLSAVFLGLWVVASMFDVLPTANGHGRWQARSTISLAVLRAVLLTVAAISVPVISAMATAMLLVTIAKIIMLGVYMRGNIGRGKTICRLRTMKKQLAYALPFAVGNALFLFRIQADQWVAVTTFAPSLYAVFSVASIILPITTLVRQPVNNAMMPQLNRAYAAGDLAEVSRLIQKCNGAAALVLLPVIGGVFVITPEFVKIAYTIHYQNAAPVMRVYLIGMIMSVFAVGHVLSALDKGNFAAMNSMVSLTFSVVISIFGAHYFGLIGAAMGSITTLIFSEIWSLRIVSRVLDVSMHQLVPWRVFWPTFSSTIFALIVVCTFAFRADDKIFSLLLVKIVFYVIAFLPCFILTGGVKQYLLTIGWQRS